MWLEVGIGIVKLLMINEIDVLPKRCVWLFVSWFTIEIKYGQWLKWCYYNYGLRCLCVRLCLLFCIENEHFNE